ncbi:MAG: hypothetical protein K9L74_03690 [Candidatus Izimaplasma sp.]|nr:hypothetical protein [Candidatus Izimaplasma bacterium]
MKKGIFLFLCVFFLTVKPINASAETYSLTEFDVIVEGYMNQANYHSYHISKQGTNYFEFDLSYDFMDVYIDNIQESETYIFIYGYAHDNQNTSTRTDGFLYIFDKTGSKVKEHIIDYHYLERIIDVYVIENSIILQLFIEEQQASRRPNFITNKFVLLDESFELHKELDISKKIRETTIIGKKIVYKVDGDNDYSGGILSDLTPIDSSSMPPIEQNAVFKERVYLEFINQAVLNGDLCQNGILITYPGHYIFEKNDQVINFQVEPTITGINNNGVYDKAVQIDYSSGRALLNNELYIKNTEITHPGYYEFIIEGINDYEKKVSFTIVSRISGVINNQTYKEPIEISFTGDGYLNNQFVSSPITIDEQGEFTLEIKGENNYSETYQFSVFFPEQKDLTKEFSFVSISVISVLIVGSSALLYKNINKH